MSDGLPTVRLRDPTNEHTRILAALVGTSLRHPVATQSAISALIAEGKRYAETDEGRVILERLRRSTLLPRARLVWEATTNVVISGDSPETLPSQFIDAVFMAAANADLEPFLHRLMNEGLMTGNDDGFTA